MPVHLLVWHALMQHPPTYTVGKRGTQADFKVSQERLIADGAEVHVIKRGGETTYHGPGQVRTSSSPHALQFPVHSPAGHAPLAQALRHSVTHQVVMYPIVNLRRLKLGARAYVEGLEDSVIATLRRYSIPARVQAHYMYHR